MNGKSELANMGITLAQIGQRIAHAVVDNGGTDENTKTIISDDALAKDIARLILGQVELVTKKVESVNYFRRLNLTAVIPATTGEMNIADQKELFPGYIDTDFKNWGLGVKGEARPETKVESLELAKSGTFKEFFTGFGDLDKLVLTDDQIIWVVKNRPDLLIQSGSNNFFLKKKGKKFFIAFVLRRSSGLRVFVNRWSEVTFWRVTCRHRLVVPQLRPLVT